MLTAGEIESMRSVLESTFPSTCVVRRNNRTSDGGGGWTDAWTNLYTNIPCRVAPAVASRGLDSQVGAAPVSRAEWMITLAHDLDVLPDDQIISDSRTFEVRVVGDRSWEISLRIFAVEVL